MREVEKKIYCFDGANQAQAIAEIELPKNYMIISICIIKTDLSAHVWVEFKVNYSLGKKNHTAKKIYGKSNTSAWFFKHIVVLRAIFKIVSLRNSQPTPKGIKMIMQPNRKPVSSLDNTKS